MKIGFGSCRLGARSEATDHVGRARPRESNTSSGIRDRARTLATQLSSRMSGLSRFLTRGRPTANNPVQRPPNSMGTTARPMEDHLPRRNNPVSIQGQRASIQRNEVAWRKEVSPEQRRSQEFENLISSIEGLNVRYKEHPEKLIDLTLKAIHDPSLGRGTPNSNVASQEALGARLSLGVTEWDTDLHTPVIVSNLVSADNFNEVIDKMCEVIGRTVGNSVSERVPVQDKIKEADEALDKLARLDALVSTMKYQVKHHDLSPLLRDQQVNSLQKLQDLIKDYKLQLSDLKNRLEQDVELIKHHALNNALKGLEKAVHESATNLTSEDAKNFVNQFAKLRQAIASDLRIRSTAGGRVGEQTDSPIGLTQKFFRKLALKVHPDKGGSAENFTQLSNAIDQVIQEMEKFASQPSSWVPQPPEGSPPNSP